MTTKIRPNPPPYRWVILAVYALISIIIQMQWLTFAPIAREVRAHYGVTAFQVDLLSLVFMAVFLVACLPASWVIDNRGLRAGVGLGAVMTGCFALMKGFFADSYAMVLAAQIGLAVAQPFILNAATALAVRWFPITERATAVGVTILAQFLGIIIVMVATPPLVGAGGPGLHTTLIVYGIIAAVGAALVLALLREKPAVPLDPGDESTMIGMGIGEMFKNRDLLLVMVLFFAGLGMFNALSTCIDQLCEQKGFTMEQSGIIGGVMLIAGIVGAIIFPLLSDRLRRRKPFMVGAMLLMTPGIAGLAYARDFSLVLASSALLGFALLGAGAPIGFQYAAEVGRPVPEATSQGIILLLGQFSGIIFIVGINRAGVVPFMTVFMGLAVLTIVLSLALRESPVARRE